jgi:hypothetical protein
MELRVRPVAAVVILSLMSFACGGGGGGGRGPTEPSGPTGKRLQFTVVAAPGNFEGGILEGAVFFDGREVGRVDWSRAGGACEFPCEVAGDVQGVSPGNHTVRFTVVRQERTTTLYQFVLSGSITDPATGTREPISQVSQRLRLRAGESVTFNVRI